MRRELSLSAQNSYATLFSKRSDKSTSRERTTMAGRSFALGLAIAGGLLFSSIAAIETTVAAPAEITVLTSVALTSALDELAQQYERASGNKVKIGYGLIADIKK